MHWFLMQFYKHLNDIKKEKIASESLYIYAPLAHRVGLFNLKNELEDLSLKTINPKIYKSIKGKFDKSQESQEKYIESFKKLIIQNLDKQKIKYSIKGRNKSIYSINNKMQKKNIPFNEVYDRFAIRIIYKSSKKDEDFSFLLCKIFKSKRNFKKHQKRFHKIQKIKLILAF